MRTIKTTAALGLLFVLLACQQRATTSSKNWGKGEQWLSWKVEERRTYLDGFISGYYNGFHEACELTDDLFQTKKAYPLGQGPSAKCMNQMRSYSRFKSKDLNQTLDSYSAILTDFYTKHPEHRQIPFFYLLQYLSDKKFKSADELYKATQSGELRTQFPNL